MNTWAAPLVVKDDTGLSVVLAQPAKRIISLAPHATELVFALGAGSHIIGRDRASDYPKAALQIEQLADFQSVQLDKLLLLKPDLVILWQNRALEKQRILLQKKGIPVFISRPQSFREIASNMERLGVLLGVTEQGKQQAKALLAEVEQMQQKYQKKPRLTVYMQIADNPMLSVNKQLFIGKMLARCGGENIFAHSTMRTPLVNIEAVLAANPDVMFYVSQTHTFLQGWEKYAQLKAIKNKAIIALNSDLISRPGPRLIEGQRLICHAMDQVRTVN